MFFRILLAPLILFFSAAAQERPAGNVGWYNGYWQPAISSSGNYYASDKDFGRTYDDFVVPAGGWTVTSVLSDNSMSVTGIAQAAWEIRAGVSLGNGGAIVASGIGAATQTYLATVGGGQSVYRIQVDGLQVHLDPGTYWLSVAPLAARGQSYATATKGKAAVGDPPGNDGSAFYYSPSSNFTLVTTSGSAGTSGDYSLGVLVLEQSKPAVTPTERWLANVAYLAQQLPLYHGQPYVYTSKQELDAKAAALYARVPTASEAEIRTGIAELVAAVGDSHTSVGWGYSTPFLNLPLTLYWFHDAFYVTEAGEPYSALLGGKVVSIGNMGIEDAAQRMAKLIAYENEWWLRENLPGKLTTADFLYGTGIADTSDSARVVVQSPSGELVSADVRSLYRDQFPRTVRAFQGVAPLYMQNSEKYYWATTIEDGATVYFQYNRCMEDPNQPFADFRKTLDEMLASDRVRRVIVDIRNNTGGSPSILDPWIDQIKAGRFNRSGALFVITGRRTFSASMVNSVHFREQTAATLVGEPTGGKPRFQIRIGQFDLPYWGVTCSYSSGFAHAADDGPTLLPDIQVDLTFDDYLQGRDPALEAILRNPPPND